MAQGTCSIGGCDKPATSRGWCEKHYTRWLRTGTTEARRKAWDLTVSERINAGLDKTGDCWLWTGSIRTGSGYPVLSVDGVQQYVHRLVYELAHGPIPHGVQVDHKCRQRRCCNLAHLRLATGKQNAENVGVRSDNTSGVRGVYRDRKAQRWAVQVQHHGKVYFGGNHLTLEAATDAARDLRNELFSHNEDDRFPEREVPDGRTVGHVSVVSGGPSVPLPR